MVCRSLFMCLVHKLALLFREYPCLKMHHSAQTGSLCTFWKIYLMMWCNCFLMPSGMWWNVFVLKVRGFIPNIAALLSSGPTYRMLCYQLYCYNRGGQMKLMASSHSALWVCECGAYLLASPKYIFRVEVFPLKLLVESYELVGADMKSLWILQCY